MLFSIIFIIFLLIASAFFSSSETAFTSLSMMQIESIGEKRGKRGKLVKKLMKKPEKLIAALLTGNNLVNITLSVVATELTLKIFGNGYIGIMTGVLTLVVLIFGEVVPKNIALSNNEVVASFAAPAVNCFIFIFTPFIYIVNIISKFLTGFLSLSKKSPFSMEAIMGIMRYAETKGVLADYETEMVYAIFRLSQQKVSTIMTRRSDVFSLEEGLTVQEAREYLDEKKFSRIPVYDDNSENITGIVLATDILKKLADDENVKLGEIKRTPFFLSGNKKIREALLAMQTEKRNMAIVLDEYSGLAGIITIEDIMEEIAGELYDEGDITENEKILELENNTYRIYGNTPIWTVNDKLGISIPIGKFSQTIGGFIIDELGRIPTRKEKIEVKGAVIIVDSVSATKINTVIVTTSKS